MAYVKAIILAKCVLCSRVATLSVHNRWNAPLGLTYCDRHRAAADKKAAELDAAEKAGPYIPRLGSAR